MIWLYLEARFGREPGMFGGFLLMGTGGEKVKRRQLDRAFSAVWYDLFNYSLPTSVVPDSDRRVCAHGGP